MQDGGHSDNFMDAIQVGIRSEQKGRRAMHNIEVVLYGVKSGFWEDPGVPLFCFRRSSWQSPRHSCALRTLRFFSMASASTSTQAPAQAGKSMQPLVAQGDWTKNLV